MICPSCGVDKESTLASIKKVLDQKRSLEMMLRQLLDAAMPIRADNATLQDIVKAIPTLHDTCHSAAIVLNLLDCRK